MAKPLQVEVYNPNGKYRVVSTKPMPGTRWINLLIEQDCRLEICTQKKTILSVEDIISLIGDKCDGVIGQCSLCGVFQLTEDWGEKLFSALSRAGGQTVGVIGAGRIGSAYARMMVISRCLVHLTYGQFLKANGEQPVTWKRASTMEEVLREADVISLHPVLDKTTYHLVNKERLAMMKKEAILVNCSRGPVIDEVALVEHLKVNPMFRVGLDVFEDEPYMKPGLAEMKNAIVVPHIASASKWTREGMATLAALNVLGKIKGYPIWSDPNRVEPFLNENATPPAACPSIVNAKALGLPVSKL
ncbi:UNVERIFIED_CONTAM: Glycerate dehydrogenase HPR, peroxisomal [Sesamum calycinum]|uniref:Glycerate dehydrogenase HPR, peroxisomal n=1 Tax=Sesamum calycinum TaxID=2727403 RepID=A0AAW2R7N7_9LAMI